MAWISNSEAGSAVRAKLNSLVVPINPATAIVTPVASFEVVLPTGYLFFTMLMVNLRIAEGDFGVALRFSTDAGVSYYAEAGVSYDNADASIVPGTATPGGNAFLADYTIYPGDAVFPARWIQEAAIATGGGLYGESNLAVTLTDPAAAGLRINKMRFAPYESDVRTIKCDAYQLFGFPIPA
jgi:hypothetical protein